MTEDIFCDFCKERFGCAGVESARIPVLYLDAVSPLLGTSQSPEDFSGGLSEYKDEWTLGYNTYNICNACLQKVVNVRVIPFAEKKYFGGLCTDLVYRGKYKAVIATPDFSVADESMRAYEESNARKCDSCAHARGRGWEGEPLCSVSKINVKDSYEFYCKRNSFGYRVDLGCPEWKHDTFMGHGDFDLWEKEAGAVHDFFENEEE